jgi:hypothetical protein
MPTWKCPTRPGLSTSRRSITLGKKCFGSPYAVAFTWERAYIPYLEALGFAAVQHLPLAADTALFDAEPASDVAARRDVCRQFDGELRAGSVGTNGAVAGVVVGAERTRSTRATSRGDVSGQGLHAIVDPAVLDSADEHAQGGKRNSFVSSRAPGVCGAPS